MNQLWNINWQLDRGCAFFEYRLDAAQRIGKYFDEYCPLLQRDNAQGSDGYLYVEGKHRVVEEQRSPCIVRFDCGLIGRRKPGEQRMPALTSSQRTMLDWILTRYGPELIDSVCETVAGCYSDKKPPRWREYLSPFDYLSPSPSDRDLLFLQRVPPAPTIPPGYWLEDFIRITNVSLNEHALTFGVLVSVAWSEEQIGLRYKANAGLAPEAPIPFWCVGVGADDTAFC